ncbi:MAG: hypothetical protein IT379_28965 [Deltaproteobacteria bacterium]|nr:hypothetical protein [Deltaproteobacteria bacterium]
MSAAVDEGGWIAIDDEPAAAMPEWARVGLKRRPEVRIGEEGIALVSSRRCSLARWSEVFGVAVLEPSRDADEARAYVLVPRRAPRPPWFEVTLDMLPDDVAREGLQGLARAVRERSQHWGYRSVRVERPRMTADELYARLLAEQAVPGAVEVPIGRGPFERESTWMKGVWAIVASGGGLLMGGYAGAIAGAIFIEALGSAAAIGGLASGAAVGAIGAAALVLKPAKGATGRVLALAPDGCVIGFRERVRALPWSDIMRFQDGYIPETGRPALVVVGSHGDVLGRVDEAWFSKPIELIVAVAEAYRKRASVVAG